MELTEDTAADLQELIEEKGVGSGELIFGSYRRVYNRIKQAFTRAQIRVESGGNDKTSVTPHYLRHNSCTWLIQDHRKEDVQQYMGYNHIATTEKYEHFKEDEVMGLRAGD